MPLRFQVWKSERKAVLLIEMGSWEKLVGCSESVLCTVLSHTGKCQEAVCSLGRAHRPAVQQVC